MPLAGRELTGEDHPFLVRRDVGVGLDAAAAGHVVVAGHVDFTVATMPGAIQHVRSGALRALGISSLTRSPELPDLPPIAEAGLPGYEYVAWFGVFAPGTTPPVLVTRINDLLRQAVNASDTRELLRVQGVTPQLLLPDQFREKVRSEIEHWAPIIEKSGMKGSL